MKNGDPEGGMIILLYLIALISMALGVIAFAIHLVIKWH